MTWAGRGAWRAYSEECEVFLGGVIGTLAFLLIFKYAFILDRTERIGLRREVSF